MNGTLIVILGMYFAACVLILVFPSVEHYMERQNEHELKIACINAGKTLIDGNCINGDTK